jgi:hypothetical protein
MNEIWERVLANSFSGIHKSKIICSACCFGQSAMICVKYTRTFLFCPEDKCPLRMQFSTVFLSSNEEVGH